MCLAKFQLIITSFTPRRSKRKEEKALYYTNKSVVFFAYIFSGLLKKLLKAIKFPCIKSADECRITKIKKQSLHEFCSSSAREAFYTIDVTQITKNFPEELFVPLACAKHEIMKTSVDKGFCSTALEILARSDVSDPREDLTEDFNEVAQPEVRHKLWEDHFEHVESSYRSSTWL